MLFTVYIAAEILGQKINLRVEFPHPPSLDELTRTTEYLFNTELNVLHPEIPSSTYRVKVQKFKVYDETTQRWLELIPDTKLLEGKQLYAFQVPSSHYRESQQELPHPRLPSRTSASRLPASNMSLPAQPHSGGAAMSATTPNTTMGVSYAPTLRTATNHPGSTSNYNVSGRVSGNPPTNASYPGTTPMGTTEKLQIIFEEMDLDRDGVVLFSDMWNYFQSIGLTFSEATVRDLFTIADANKDNEVRLDEFSVFGAHYPIMMDCLYYHSPRFCDNQQLRIELAHAREASHNARVNLENIQHNRANVQKALAENRTSLSELDRDLQEVLRSVAELSSYAQEARRRAEATTLELQELEVFTRDLKNQCDHHQASKMKIQRAHALLQKKSSNVQSDTARLQDLILQLTQQLHDAQRDMDRNRKLGAEYQNEMNLLVSSEQHLDELIADTHRSVAESERRLLEVRDRHQVMYTQETGYEMKLQSAQRKVDELENHKKQVQSTLEYGHGELRKADDTFEDALKYFEDVERRTQELEKDLTSIFRNKQRVTDSERTVIEQEVRLREQRMSLEEKEMVLLRNASAIVSSVAMKS